MAHISRERDKLQLRVRRIRGQVEAIERALDDPNHDCSDVLQLVAACRGALNGLMAELIEGHIRYHVLGSDKERPLEQAEAAEQLVEVVRAYLK